MSPRSSKKFNRMINLAQLMKSKMRRRVRNPATICVPFLDGSTQRIPNRAFPLHERISMAHNRSESPNEDNVPQNPAKNKIQSPISWTNKSFKMNSDSSDCEVAVATTVASLRSNNDLACELPSPPSSLLNMVQTSKKVEKEKIQIIDPDDKPSTSRKAMARNFSRMHPYLINSHTKNCSNFPPGDVLHSLEDLSTIAPLCNTLMGGQQNEDLNEKRESCKMCSHHELQQKKTQSIAIQTDTDEEVTATDEHAECNVNSEVELNTIESDERPTESTEAFNTSSTVSIPHEHLLANESSSESDRSDSDNSNSSNLLLMYPNYIFDDWIPRQINELRHEHNVDELLNNALNNFSEPEIHRIPSLHNIPVNSNENMNFLNHEEGQGDGPHNDSTAVDIEIRFSGDDHFSQQDYEMNDADDEGIDEE